jgi:phenylalanyl-tRNA synthetase beta chain
LRVPLEWLREFVDVGLVSKDLADRLTMAGAEVSAIEFHGKGIEGIVVGKIKTIERHPKADDLNIVQVDTGAKIAQLVTNLKTLKVGDKVPVAMHGARLAKNIRVEKRELHGIESFGMLCSLEHLGLADESIDVMKLDKNAPLGENIVNVLGVKGTILEVDVLPNRGDLLSIKGVAREVSAVLDKQLKPHEMKLKETGRSIRGLAQVKIEDPDLCQRYMARVIENVHVKGSPSWLKERLIACGLRPINNIVDVTNYVLLEMGQPLHAFDLKLIDGQKVIVRRARGGEIIVTLDGEKRQLTSDMLVIADPKKAVAVAGVMGAGNSEVNEGTRSILLESAYFDPVSINKTSRALKIRTEASGRFEKGVDFDGVATALDRAAGLIAELSGGVIAKGSIDVKKSDIKPKIVQLSIKSLNSILGADIPRSAILSILKRLGFVVRSEKTGDRLAVTVPSARARDIEREIDVIEEVARIYGYGKIREEIPRITYDHRKEDADEKVLDRIRQAVKGLGFFETQTFSIVDPKEIEALPLPVDDPRKDPLKITNPLSEDVSAMRTTLLPSLLGVISRNISRQSKDLALFEIGNVFEKGENNLPRQTLKLALAVTGDVLRGAFKISGPDHVGFYLVKAALELVFEELGVSNVDYVLKDDPLLEPGISCEVVVNGSSAGCAGEIGGSLMRKYDLQGDVYAAEIELDVLLAFISRDKRYKALGRFPKVSRDIAMFVPSGVSHRDIMKTIRELGGNLVENIHLFDCYKGKQVPEGYFGLAYGVDYRDPNKTLTDNEVNSRHDAVMNALTERLKVQIRRS